MALWRVATFTKGIRDELAQQRKELNSLENEMELIQHRQDARHVENQTAIHALEVVLAKQPDKEDFRRLADFVRVGMNDLKQSIENRHAGR